MSKLIKSSKLNANKNNLFIIHYACSSFDDLHPAISSISAYDTRIKAFYLVSRANLSKEDEVRFLEEFLNLLKYKLSSGSLLVGWFWNEKYGIAQILKRYKQLTGKKPKLAASKLKYFDFFKILSAEFDGFFGGFKALAEFNGIDLNQYVDGMTEIKLLKAGEFGKLNESTSSKVEVLREFISHYLNRTLRVPTLDEFFYSRMNRGAYPVFQENIAKIEQLINEKNVKIDDKKLQAFLRGLLYANVISCLETYLSDNFIRTIVNELRFLEKYLSESVRFSKQSKKSETYSELFNEIGEDETSTVRSFLVNRCIEDIKEITFHNINTSSKLYKNVLGIQFSSRFMPALFKAVEIRHDLVHRNGKNKDDQRTVIRYDQLLDLIHTIKKFVKVVHQDTEKASQNS